MASTNKKRVKLRLRDRRLVALAWGVAMFIRLALSCLGYNTLRLLLPKTGATPDAPAAFARRVSYCVDVASRAIPGATCLVRALTAKTLLAMKGYGSELHIGVAKEDNAPLQAHAWLTSGGMSVAGDDEDEGKKYIPLTIAS